MSFHQKLWIWIAGFTAATVLSLLVATQNYFALMQAGRPIPWWQLAVGELPVWYSWAAFAPAIVMLTRRFPITRGRWLLHVLLHAVAAITAIVLMLVATTATRALIPGALPADVAFWTLIRQGFVNTFALFLIVYGAIVALGLAWRYYHDVQARQIRESQLEAELVRSQLDALRAQIHPHFLFNTLHVISALMSDDVPAARKMIRRLSELLRLSLEEGTHEVTLDDELRFLDQYVEIQRMRFGGRLDVRYNVEPEAREILVPRLLLQPIVENSIKHGFAGQRDTGRITVAAEITGDSLHVCVADTGSGFASPSSVFEGDGVGLANTRARLAHLYGERHEFRIANAPEGGARVEIGIPRHRLPAD